MEPETTASSGDDDAKKLQGAEEPFDPNAPLEERRSRCLVGLEIRRGSTSTAHFHGRELDAFTSFELHRSCLQ